MSTDRDTTRIVRSWLDEGVTALPDRVLDAVLDELPATPQRRVWWPAWRFPDMNTAARFGLAAAAVVVAALLGFNYLIAPNIGARGPSEPSPTPAPPAELLPPPGPLDEGTYWLGEAFPVPLAFDVPDGLSVCGDPRELGLCLSSVAGVTFLIVENVVIDPCDLGRALRDPPVGPSVDDLVSAITELPGFRASSVADVIVDGYQGKEFELTAPDPAGCELDGAGLGTWSSANRVNGVGPGETNRVRIVDVDGTRVALFLAFHPETSASDVDRLQEIFDSIRFEDR